MHVSSFSLELGLKEDFLCVYWFCFCGYLGRTRLALILPFHGYNTVIGQKTNKTQTNKKLIWVFMSNSP